MNRMKRRVSAVFALCLMLGASHAYADVTFDLGVPNAAVSAVAGPYVQVTLKDISTNVVEVDVTALNTSSLGTSAQAQAQVTSIGFNLASGSPSSLTLSYVPPSGQPSGWSTSVGSGQEDGFGHYNFVVGPNGNANSTPSVDFQLTGTGLSTSSFLVNGQYDFAAHWFSNFGTGESQVTGFVATPEPSVIACAGTVTLFGMGLAWRRRRKARAA